MLKCKRSLYNRFTEKLLFNSLTRNVSAIRERIIVEFENNEKNIGELIKCGVVI